MEKYGGKFGRKPETGRFSLKRLTKQPFEAGSVSFRATEAKVQYQWKNTPRRGSKEVGWLDVDMHFLKINSETSGCQMQSISEN